MRLRDQIVGLCLCYTLEHGLDIHGQRVAARVVAANAHGHVHLRRFQREALELEHVLQRAAKAGGVACGKKLLGVKAYGLGAGHFFGHGHFKAHGAPFYGNLPVASANRYRRGVIYNLHDDRSFQHRG